MENCIIPTVDLADLGVHNVGAPEKSTFDRVSQELHDAFTTVGFVYLKNHGVDRKVVESLFEKSKTFFHLPDEVKRRYSCGVDQCDGYTGRDGEILDRSASHEIRETYDISSPDGIYPDEDAPQFRQAVNELAPMLCQLTSRLMRCMAVALGLEEDFFVDRHEYMYRSSEKNRTIFRTLYYPALGDADVEPGLVRCGAHTDYGTITLLMQDGLGGLEVLLEDKWVPAVPIPDTIMINLGDMMQFWTGDRYRATMHRVVVPQEEVRRRTVRHSIAFFVHPDDDVMIAPMVEDSSASEKYTPVNALDYVKSRLIASDYK